MKNHISIVIPTYNEKRNIEILIPKIFDVLKKNDLSGEVIIVDDNSPDKTYSVVKGFMKRYNVKLIQRKEKLGLGSAYKEGFSKASGDIIFQMDADLSHEPKSIPMFIEKIKQGFDMVLGSRAVKDGKRQGSTARKIFPFMGNLLYRIIGSTVKDSTSGYRCFKKSILDKIKIKDLPDNFAFLTAILFRVLENGGKIAEIPINFDERKFGEPKYSSKEMLGNLKLFFNLLSNSSLSRAQFIRFSMVGALGTLVNILVLYFLVEFISLWYMVSATIAFVVALTNNYIFNRLWTFSSKEIKILKQYSKFFAINMIGLVINLSILYALVEFENLWYVFAQILSITAAWISNFMGNKLWVFKN